MNANAIGRSAIQLFLLRELRTWLPRELRTWVVRKTTTRPLIGDGFFARLGGTSLAPKRTRT